MPKASRLNLVGLGLDFPRQATLETLEVLQSSDVIANNLSREGIVEFLSLFCKDVRPVSFRGDDAGHWADHVLKMLAPGKTVTFVTRGHPLVSGHIAGVLVAKAKSAGIECRSYSAISTIDEALCVAQEAIQETSGGLQVYDSRMLMSGAAKLQPGVPAVVYFGVPSGPGCETPVARALDWLAGMLKEQYEPDRAMILHRPEYGDRNTERLAAGKTAARLRELPPGEISSVFLYLAAA